MAEPKPLASLTSGLLARKGGARPAMRRQMALGHDATTGALDDLGWNDMGYDVDPADDGASRHLSGLSPMVSHEPVEPAPAAILPMPGVEPMAAEVNAPEPVVVQQRRRVQALEGLAPAGPATLAPVRTPARRAPRGRAEAGANGRFAFTLRLDAQRHLLLRLASAATNRSAQQILVALVDDYFATQPAVSAMAAQLSDPAHGSDVSGENA